MDIDKKIRNKIMELVHKRGSAKTICPSEAARAVESGDWRSLMDQTRRIAAILKKENKICIEQNGREVDFDNINGPIRLRLYE